MLEVGKEVWAFSEDKLHVAPCTILSLGDTMALAQFKDDSIGLVARDRLLKDKETAIKWLMGKADEEQFEAASYEYGMVDSKQIICIYLETVKQ